MKDKLIKIFTKLWKTERSLKIEILLFILSILTLLYTIHHNRVMSTPVLQISVDEKSNGTVETDDDTVSIKIENLGLGPAKIIFSDSYISNNTHELQKISSMSEVEQKMAEIGWEGNFLYSWADLHPSSYMAINKVKHIITLNRFRPKTWEHGKKIFTSVCYCSIYNQCFYTSNNTYHEENSCSIKNYLSKRDGDKNKYEAMLSK